MLVVRILSTEKIDGNKKDKNMIEKQWSCENGLKHN